MSAHSTVDKIDQMTVVQLRELLKEHNLPTAGLKAELIARAKAHHLGTSSARRHTSPSRHTSPHRSPSRVSSSSGSSLATRQRNLLQFIMSHTTTGRDDLESAIYYGIDRQLRELIESKIRNWDPAEDAEAREALSEWQLSEIQKLSAEGLAEAEALMKVLQPHNIFAARYYDSDYEGPEFEGWKPVYGFFVADGQFFLRQLIPLPEERRLFPNLR